jgi:hypothetical protein
MKEEVSMKSLPIGIKSILMVVLGFTFLLPMSAFAESPFYITFKPGTYFPESSNLDVGFNGEFALGYRFHPNIAAELGFGYFNTSKDVRGVGATRTIEEECYYDIFPFTLTVKAILPYKRWEFFGLGGGGIYFATGPYNYDDYDYYYDDEDDYDPHTDTVWGGYLGGGVHYNITRNDATPKIFVGVEGKYLWTDKVKLNGETRGVPLNASFRLDGIIVSAVIGIRF